VAPGIAQYLTPQQAGVFGFGSRAGQQQMEWTPENVTAILSGQTPMGFGADNTMVNEAGETVYAPQNVDALTQLRAASGVYGPEAQQAFYNSFVEDPGTQYLREQGLRDINRQMAATGGLGGGSRLKAITEFSQNLANQNLANRLNELGTLAQTDLSVAGQLGGLRTGLGSNIASGLANAGAARAQGQIAGAGLQNQFLGNVMQLAGTAAMAMGSDKRLKTHFDHVGDIDGVRFWTWEWNQTAHDLGLDQAPTFGVIAQEVQGRFPDCVSEGEDGYLRVNYPRLLQQLTFDEVA